MNNKQIYCAPGEKLSEDIINKLQEANNSYTREKNYPKYMRDIQKIFNLESLTETTEMKFFLAGFIEGESSFNVSIKKLNTAMFGVLVDAEFSITQQVNGVKSLYIAMVVLKAGRLRYKSGSNATLVLTIDNRQTLEDKVLPFWRTYVQPYVSTSKLKRFQSFQQILHLFNTNCHRNLDCLTNEILPLWDSMRMQKGQSNETFSSLEDAQNYARTFRKI
jgi:hypothetical protein